MRIDPAAARKVLFEEAAKAQSQSGNKTWNSRFEKLDELCGKVGRTHSPALAMKPAR
jgi:hypothetical protein